jgi:hypothetical protein
VRLFRAAGVRPDEEAKMSEVTVRIRRDPGAPAPTADPDQCRVRDGDLVVFVGEAAFEIAFEDASPGPSGAPLRLPSQAGQGMQQARLPIRNRKGTYRYAIRMDGAEADPAIIIH